jgi:quinolinate synthase
MADFIGSTSAIINWCGNQDANEFIICVESGIRHSLLKNAPHKHFYFLANDHCNCSECPYTRMNTLEKLLACLETLTPRVQVSDSLLERARLPYERMLKVQ